MADTTFVIIPSRDGAQKSAYPAGNAPISIGGSGALTAQAAAVAGVATGSAAGGGSSSFGRVFFDDFSSGALNTAWTRDDFNRPFGTVVSTSVDGVAPQTGTYMLETNWDGNGTYGVDDFSGAVLPAWSYNNECLIRIVFRFANDVDTADGRKLIRVGSNTQPQNIIFEVNGDGSTKINVIEQDGGGQEGWPSTHLDDHQWHMFEIYLRNNDIGQSNGICRIFFDNGSADPNLTAETSYVAGAHWYPFYWMSNWSNHAHDSNNHVYMDRIEIFSDTGTGGLGSMSDGSASA
jgi:hypothetical protein